MAKLSVNQMTTLRWSFEEDIHSYREVRIDGLGVWRAKLSDFGEEKGVELIRDCGFQVSSLHWAGGFTGSDGRTHKDSIEDAVDAIRQASILSARCLVMHSGGRAGHTHKHARRLFRSALDQLLNEATDHEVVLALEPMHPGCAQDWTFYTSIEETLDVLREYNSPYLKMVFDAYHLGHDEGVLTQIPDVVPHLALVQLGDAKSPPDGEQNRCNLGDGCLPLQEIVSTILANGYDDFFEVELLGEDLEANHYHQTLHEAVESFQKLLTGGAAHA